MTRKIWFLTVLYTLMLWFVQGCVASKTCEVPVESEEESPFIVHPLYDASGATIGGCVEYKRR